LAPYYISWLVHESKGKHGTQFLVEVGLHFEADPCFEYTKETLHKTLWCAFFEISCIKTFLILIFLTYFKIHYFFWLKFGPSKACERWREALLYDYVSLFNNCFRFFCPGRLLSKEASNPVELTLILFSISNSFQMDKILRRQKSPWTWTNL